ncbi:hypothetical protein Q5P01_006343 [Channa striata]|uniref:Uncharacterized protein n=1 Tax=Channa striata TaxID=64152 RepID=A0AA88SWX2_CHASR|nr:hypothetical protein Q5P01_006343 [Channa striata]
MPAIIPTAREHSSWLLRSQPREETAPRTRQGSTPPGRKETGKCRIGSLAVEKIMINTSSFKIKSPCQR